MMALMAIPENTKIFRKTSPACYEERLRLHREDGFSDLEIAFLWCFRRREGQRRTGDVLLNVPRFQHVEASWNRPSRSFARN
ncbi:uncharacterized protein LOC135121485 isoform X4 [Zophobas morio]|uniref:uncharacterized protein LOC135121485 isoform X4 n=1 Tax=Zophobas morio TaxID=2755281 RepID=UPI0030828802